MKKSFFILLFFCASLFSFSQNLMIHSGDRGLYLQHQVAAKENFYSIGRLYNVAPKEIAAFNSVDMNNGLSVGQSLMIPLTENNFSQSANRGTPVYYTVAEKEGLYRVSMNNNKVSLDELRKWNGINGDNISAGQKLIVGYLLSSEMQSVARAEQSAPAQELGLPNRPPQTEQQSRNEQPKNITQVSNPVAVGGAGYFKTQFEQQSRTQPSGKNATVTSGIFKTASGWQDAKYYALLDQVEPGTIVQVVNPTNNKAIYAKVLGEMSGIRQNQGLELRISNAAAAALDVADTEKFIVRVSY
jgi:LysM repeat protein